MVVPFLQTSTFTGLISTKDNKTSQEWGDTYTLVQTNSGIWGKTDAVLPTIANYLSTNNIYIYDANILENLTVTGNISAFGKYVQLHNSQSVGEYTIAANEGVAINNFSAAFNKGEAQGVYSFVEGFNTIAAGEISHAEGDTTLALGNISHAEGFLTQALGDFSHAEGESTTASGQTSHVEGSNTFALGEASHAEGFSNQALGDFSHAEGEFTTASGRASHSGGSYAEAVYDRSWIWKGTTSTNISGTTRPNQLMVVADGGIALYNKVGIGTDNINNALTVVGTISSNNIIYSNQGNSNQWNTAYQNVSSQALNTDNTVTFKNINVGSSNVFLNESVQGAIGINLIGTERFRFDYGSNSFILLGGGASIAFGPSNTTGAATTRQNLGLGTAAQMVSGSFALSSIYQDLTGKWDSTYTTVLNNSSTNWNYQGTDLKQLSANWQSTYATVTSLSSTWGSGGTDLSTVKDYLSTSNVLVSSLSVTESISANGLVYSTNNIVQVKTLIQNENDLDASRFGIFYKVVSSDSAFTFANFNAGQTITLYLSANHGTIKRHTLPSPTYLSNVSEANEIYTYNGYITKTTIQRIGNEYYGISNIIKTNTIQNPGIIGRIVLDQSSDFLVQENSDRLLL